MKDSYFAKTLMPAEFALGLFASQQNFILTTPENSPVGQGMFEAGFPITGFTPTGKTPPLHSAHTFQSFEEFIPDCPLGLSRF